MDEQAKEFVRKYNKRGLETIPDGFYDSILTSTGVELIEMLARYGNPSKFEMPTPL